MEVIPILNDFPLSEVIFHPRIARQLYSGSPDWELFAQVAEILKHRMVYNGDLLTKEDLSRAQKKFKAVSTWMIGRGMLKNPFLAAEIKGEQFPGKGERIAKLERFQEEIFSSYATMLSGQSHLIMRMIKFWEYFCFLFPNPHKAFKRVKKSINVAKYELAIKENFMQMRDEA